MSPLLVVAVLVAGALGAVARYGVSIAFLRSSSFPRAVLLVNVVGCLIGGSVYGLVQYFTLSADLRLVLLTGLAGGLTTFSTWSVETMQLLESGRWRTAVASVALNLVLGLAVAVAAYGVVYFILLSLYRT